MFTHRILHVAIFKIKSKVGLNVLIIENVGMSAIHRHSPKSDVEHVLRSCYLKDNGGKVRP